MEAYTIVVIFSLLMAGGIYLSIRYPKLRKILPEVKKLFYIVQTVVDNRGFKRSYSDKLGLGTRYINLAITLGLEGTDLREARNKVGALIAETYDHFYTGTLEYEKAKSVATSGYMAVLSYPNILETIKGLQDHENLDVRKATYVVIDILGELFDRKDKLSKEYFQHLVYGLNKCLVLFKKGGHSRKTLTKIYATLWRIYKLTKAYNKLKAGQGLTKKDFYEKLTAILDSMLRVLGE